MGVLSRAAAAAIAVAALTTPVASLETDPFYAWGRDIADSADALDARMNAEIGLVLERVNASRGASLSCDGVVDRILRRMRQFLFHRTELWLLNAPEIARVPDTPDDEREYRKRYLLHDTYALDVATWMPPSPTIEVDGIRIGTDKIAHFVSQGGYYRRWYLEAIADGRTPDEAAERAIRRGMWVERRLLGWSASGVLSLADLEANERGMRWLVGLCHGDAPGLALRDGRWTAVRPFAIRDHITPDWDEWWNPNLYTHRRWKKVLPVLREHCPMLDDPGVRAMRARYAAADRRSATERMVDEAIAEGRLPSREAFRIETVCAGVNADADVPDR